MRAFVIWEPKTSTVRTLLEALPQMEHKHGGAQVEWDIPHLSASGRPVVLGGAERGHALGRDILRRGLEEADHAIALLDHQSASTGFQIGMALGLGKSLRLAYVGAEAPEWTRTGALKGLLAYPLRDITEIPELLVPLRWDFPAVKAEGGAGPLLLCPSGPAGSTLRQVALDVVPRLRTLPEDGWGLYEVPALLAGSEVIWVIAPDLRDGGQNAANAVVAGFAEATGRRVRILRAAEHPPVVGLEARELSFGSIGEFRQKLASNGEAEARPHVPMRILPAPSPDPGPSRRSPVWFLAAGLLLGGGGVAASALYVLRSAVKQPPPVSAAAPAPVVAAVVPAATPAVTPPVAAAPAPVAAPAKASRSTKSKRTEPVPAQPPAPADPRRVDPTRTPITTPSPSPEPEPPRAPVQAPPPSRSRCPAISSSDMDRVMQSITAAWNNERKDAFQHALRGRCLTSSQLARGLNELMFGDRLPLLRAIAKQVTDRDNDAVLMPLFWATDHAEVRRLLAGD